ncbi:MAG: hypothetical protein ACRDYV_18045 [Acidimicrobiia bacterium]
MAPPPRCLRSAYGRAGPPPRRLPARIGKLNIDEHHTVFDRVDSKSIPTMVLYVKGEARHLMIGAGRTLEELRAELEPHLV